MRFEKINQTEEGKPQQQQKNTLWLTGHIAVGNNEHSSKFPNCDIGLFY